MTVPSKAVQRACKILRKRVRFESASFRLSGERMSSEADTAAIREATRLYMETWVVPLIDAIQKGDTYFMQTFSRGMEL